MDILNPWARAAISRPIRPIPKMPEPLTAHLRAEREGFTPRPRSRANETVTNAEAARCRQQQCQTKVRHIVGEDVRRRRDTDAPSFCLSEVYRVGPMPLIAMISSEGKASMIVGATPLPPPVATPRIRAPTPRRKPSGSLVLNNRCMV